MMYVAEVAFRKLGTIGNIVTGRMWQLRQCLGSITAEHRVIIVEAKVQMQVEWHVWTVTFSLEITASNIVLQL